VITIHERKALMSKLSDPFVIAPGGFDTYEEFLEAVTWTQLGLHDKRCGLFNVEGYFDDLLAFFRACPGASLHPQATARGVGRLGRRRHAPRPSLMPGRVGRVRWDGRDGEDRGSP
jgi:hypothetical protein